MSAFDFVPTPLPGCFEIRPRRFEDRRGRFVKTMFAPEFEARGLAVAFPEEYYSFSRRDVVRGLHFQTPPHDHDKLVYCPHGAVLDVVVDLRRGSPTYGQTHSVRLDDEGAAMLYVPSGLAHGFMALTDAVMQYKVTSLHAPEHDRGIAWDSVGFDWPVREAVLSDRDRTFPPLSAFESPFVFSGPVA